MSKEEKKGKGKKKLTLTKGNTKVLGYGLVVMFLMVWVFVLGVLAGRGDVNYLFQRLGLYKTNLAARLGMSPNTQSPALVLPQSTEEHKALADGGKKPAQELESAEIYPAAASPSAKTTDQVASKPPAEPVKKNGIVTAEAKKPKGSNQQKHDPEHSPAAKHEQDRSVASKLNFQNSLDTPMKKQIKTVAKKEAPVHTAPPPGHTASAPVHTASIAPQSHHGTEPTAGEEKKKAACAYQVKVASYKSTEEAEKTVADLKKKGISVNLQKSKDKTGNAVFIIKTGRYSNKNEAEKVNKKLKEAKINGQIQEVN